LFLSPVSLVSLWYFHGYSCKLTHC